MHEADEKKGGARLDQLRAECADGGGEDDTYLDRYVFGGQDDSSGAGGGVIIDWHRYTPFAYNNSCAQE